MPGRREPITIVSNAKTTRGSAPAASSAVNRETFSDLANLAELHYRDAVQAVQDSPAAFVKKVEESGRLQLLPYLRSRGIIAPQGAILEIGAGSGWLSAQLSRLPEVSRVVATDFSRRLVTEVMPVMSAQLGADPAKIEHRIADFHRLPFEDATFDWVCADSALHHATDVTAVLKEVRRVLKPDGWMFAVREPVRPLIAAAQLRARKQVVDALAHEGVPEPLYRRREWHRFFQDAGFDLTWQTVSFSRGLRRWAATALNGLVKADYCLVGRPRC